jgi:hypothetical protein
MLRPDTNLFLIQGGKIIISEKPIQSNISSAPINSRFIDSFPVDSNIVNLVEFGSKVTLHVDYEERIEIKLQPILDPQILVDMRAELKKDLAANGFVITEEIISIY